MPTFIKICLFVLTASLFPNNVMANPANNGLMASNGVEYRLAPQPPEGVEWLQSGEKVALAAHTCEPPKVVDWIREEVTCTTARVVRSDRDGITETGGVTTRETGPRFYLIIAWLAMALMAVAMVRKNFFEGKPTTGSPSFLAFVLGTGLTLLSSMLAGICIMIVVSHPSLEVNPNVVGFFLSSAMMFALVASFAIYEFKGKKLFNHLAWIFQGLMAAYLCLV